ncbi:hypothetical protein M409DRAFT_68136 [Zasmidium cellare ATCC 36951]|uniref:Uncharacterized protein n=1 Tax=Zasmidium cellare ATCC 36951 TaxID=1080233 RepID=A0A6A6CCB7_ZASCE|nr:uncharacterized protein M409DRAFT_68136 [Zasmidium cellare ATCC 36951]KAF2163860.1 hypothetical protein M409DRAFT_68136 [Zasmidium cellare ATCC 36951]
MAREISSEKAASSIYEREPPRYNYKPAVLRTIPLLILFLVTLGLIGLLEYARIELAAGENRLSFSSSSNNKRRDFGYEYVYLRDTPSQASEDATATPSAASAIPESPDAGTVTADQSPSGVTQYIQSSNYVNPEQTITPDSTIETSNYVGTDNTQTIALSPASGDYVPTEHKQTVTSGMTAMALPTSDYVDPSRTHTIAYSAPTGDYVPTENTRTMPAPTPTTTVVTTSSASVIVASASTSAILITSGGQTITSHTTISAHSSTTQVALTQTIVSTPASNPPEPSSSSDAYVLQNSGKVGVISYKWDPGNVFLATYLTVVIAVLYRMLITILNNNFTLIEPFRQLMEPNGAPAERAFFSFYQNQSNLYGPIPALSKGRWALALVSTAYLIASTLPALASEAIWVDTNWNCLSPIQGSKNPCQPRMTVSVTVVRIMQGLLAFIALVIVFITILLLVKRTGLPANPSSIATIGSLMRHPGLVDDINNLPVGPGARVSEMKAAMAGKRYKLERYKTEMGALHYGIRPLTIDLHDEYSTRSKGRGSYTPIDNNGSSFSEGTTKSHRFRWMDLILLLLTLGTFGVVLAYYLDGNPDGFNNFFSSNTFGPRFILTLAGTLIATSWHSIEQTAVVMAPYIALATKPSPARRTLCFTPSNTPLLSTWTTLRNRYPLPALITFTTLMAEALNIVISGVPFATGQTWGQFLVSAYMSLAILGIMVLVVGLVMLRRRKEPKIPVRPDTLAGKMYYLSGSRVLDDFEGLDGVGQSVRDKRLCGLGKRYAFQPMMRRDGRRTWLVDEVGDERGSS